MTSLYQTLYKGILNTRFFDGRHITGPANKSIAQVFGENHAVAGGSLRALHRSQAELVVHKITTEPNELVRPVHNRVPVILRPEDEEQWLDVFRTTFTKARSVLKPLPES